MMASPFYGAAPSSFLEWDGKNLTVVPGPPNAPSDGSFYGNMLVLPTGQILLDARGPPTFDRFLTPPPGLRRS